MPGLEEIIKSWYRGHKFIDRELQKSIAPRKTASMKTLKKSYSNHRRVDYHRAIEAWLETRELKTKIESEHTGAALLDILQHRIPAHVKRLIAASQKTSESVDYENTEHFPQDCFWTFFDNGKAGAIRMLHNHYQKEVEIAFEDEDALGDIAAEIEKLSVEHSIYRNKFLQVDIVEPMQDDYGHSSQADGMQITFRKPPTVTEEQIIFDPNVKRVIDRNVISFFQNRDRLHELGLPLQRGVLFYGPPGTGKTYTCQYIHGKLKPVTTITVTGKGLGQVRTICSLARLLHPSVLVLEDVDLIFTSREINLYSTALGDMMDELDAFKREESVLFILTTNSIERLEAAIKDRPGRISQCIFFGPPTRDLRIRYLQRYLEAYDSSNLSMEYIADISDGGSQAFLEELVYRTVQIAAESNGDKIVLKDEYFKEAVDEMTGHQDQSAGSILGFRFDT